MSKASPRTEAFDIMSKTKRGSVCVILHAARERVNYGGTTME